MAPVQQLKSVLRFFPLNISCNCCACCWATCPASWGIVGFPFPRIRTRIRNCIRAN